MNSKKKIREYVLLEKSTPRKRTLGLVHDFNCQSDQMLHLRVVLAILN